MNILVLSDSHRDHLSVKQLLDTYNNQVQMAVHLGDHANDLLQYEHAYPCIEMRSVSGNCDYGTFPPLEIMLSVYGCSILLLHGHMQNVKYNTDRLAYYAEEKNASACLFGHTHSPTMFDRGSVLFFNPGSVAEPRGKARGTYGLLSVSEEGLIKGKIMNL